VTGSVEVDVEYLRDVADLGPAEGRVKERKHQMSSWVGTGPVYHGAQSCSCPERAALPNHMKW